MWFPRKAPTTLLAPLLLPLVATADITVDGVLDEPEWREARSFDAFVTTEDLANLQDGRTTQRELQRVAEDRFRRAARKSCR